MSILKISSEQLPNLPPGLEETLNNIHEACQTLGVDLFLAGAFAKDIWLSFATDKPPARRTKDLDFGIELNSERKFQGIKDFLVEKKGFSTSGQSSFTLFSPQSIQVDILPFGDIGDESGMVVLAGREEKPSIRAQGFREAFQHSLQVEIGAKSKVFNVCTLPGTVILKLISFDDRPEVRQKDLQDLMTIIEEYQGVMQGDLYGDYPDVLGMENDFLNEPDFLYNFRVNAQILGREISTILDDSPSLRKRIETILENAIVQDLDSPLMKGLLQFASGIEERFTLQCISTLIKDLLRGIRHTATP